MTRLLLSLLPQLWLLLSSNCNGFRPLTPVVVSRPSRTTTFLSAKDNDSSSDLDSLTLDEEVEALVEKEVGKTKRMSNLRNANGVEYAPWMNISEQDEAKIRAMMREKAEARRRRAVEESTTKGSLMRDSTVQELSGGGLRSKVVDGNCVELEWATGSEASTRGFIVKRRPAKTDDFQVLASYESYGPLASKGKDGGVYRYLDENVPVGGWLYRITECEANGEENDLSQCLVDIETDEERQLQTAAVAVFATLAVAALAAGLLLDPLQ
jgi:hypothetical protein